MTNIFFTADLHFCHDRNFIYESRGFNSINEMNEIIVENINNYVKFDDELYLLGDLMLRDNVEGLKLLKNLNGFKHIIFGNHCTKARQELYKEIPNCMIHGYADLVKIRRKTFYLSHQPTIMSNGYEKVPICLHGHTHSKNPLEFFRYNCVNVGMDAWDCRPVSLEEIRELIRKERDRIKNKGWFSNNYCRCDSFKKKLTKTNTFNWKKKSLYNGSLGNGFYFRTMLKE